MPRSSSVRSSPASARWSLSFKLLLLNAVPIGFLMLTLLALAYAAGQVQDAVSLIRGRGHASGLRMAEKLKQDVIEVQQWLTDVSATRGRDGLDSGWSEAESRREAFLKGVREFRQEFERDGAKAEAAKLDELLQAFEAYYRLGTVMAKAYVEEGPEAGNRRMKEFDETSERLTQLLDPLVEAQTVKFNASLDGAEGSVVWLRNIALGAGLVGVLASLLIVVAVTRAVTRPIRAVVQVLGEGAGRVADAADQMSDSSRNLAEGASQQAASLEETGASLEQMSDATRANAASAQRVRELVAQARSVADQGAADMHQMMAAMSAIEASSASIAGVLKSIDEIAFQTNILALNAAVEAARAGETGRGFAVVADAVRTLAQRSAQSARETSSQIETARADAQRGSEVCSRVSQLLDQIVNQVRQVDQLIGEVASASQEQSQGLSQINSAVVSMDRVVQGEAAAAEEGAAASQELNHEADRLRGVIGELGLLVDGGTVQGVGAVPRDRPRSRPAGGRSRPAEAPTSVSLGA